MGYADDEDVRHVLRHPETLSSGVDAAHIGRTRPVIPPQDLELSW